MNPILWTILGVAVTALAYVFGREHGSANSVDLVEHAAGQIIAFNAGKAAFSDAYEAAIDYAISNETLQRIANDADVRADEASDVIFAFTGYLKAHAEGRENVTVVDFGNGSAA